MLLAETLEKNFIFSHYQLYNYTYHEYFQMEKNHVHSRYEIMYVKKGEFELTVYPGNKPEKYTLKQGEFVFLDAFEKHYIEVPKTCSIMNIEFSAEPYEKINDLDLRKYLNGFPSYVDFAKNLQGYAIMNDIINLNSSLEIVHKNLLDSKKDEEIKNLIDINLIILLVNTARCSQFTKSGIQSPYVNKVIYYIQSNIDQNLTVPVLAKYVKINHNYLQHLFKSETGESIINYINKLRIDMAKKLLLNTDTSIIDIGITVGFNTRQNFTHIFKKHTGMSPTDYRKEVKPTEYAINIV